MRVQTDKIGEKKMQKQQKIKAKELMSLAQKDQEIKRSTEVRINYMMCYDNVWNNNESKSNVTAFLS